MINGPCPALGSSSPCPSLPSSRASTAPPTFGPVSSYPSHSSCHQCKSVKSRSLVVSCQHRAPMRSSSRARSCRKKYCSTCLLRSYELKIEDLTAEQRRQWKCPACSAECKCAACQRGKSRQKRSRRDRQVSDDRVSPVNPRLANSSAVGPQPPSQRSQTTGLSYAHEALGVAQLQCAESRAFVESAAATASGSDDTSSSHETLGHALRVRIAQLRALVEPSLSDGHSLLSLPEVKQTDAPHSDLPLQCASLSPFSASRSNYNALAAKLLAAAAMATRILSGHWYTPQAEWEHRKYQQQLDIHYKVRHANDAAREHQHQRQYQHQHQNTERFHCQPYHRPLDHHQQPQPRPPLAAVDSLAADFSMLAHYGLPSTGNPAILALERKITSLERKLSAIQAATQHQWLHEHELAVATQAEAEAEAENAWSDALWQAEVGVTNEPLPFRAPLPLKLTPAYELGPRF